MDEEKERKLTIEETVAEIDSILLACVWTEQESWLELGTKKRPVNVEVEMPEGVYNYLKRVTEQVKERIEGAESHKEIFSVVFHYLVVRGLTSLSEDYILKKALTRH